MEKCLNFNFSITSTIDWLHRQTFYSAGLRPLTTYIGDGTTMHCWVPRDPRPHKPSLLLLHGFGANTMWHWSDQIPPFLLSRFNVYVPDLLFFGHSLTTRPDRSESTQARSVMALMESMGVSKMSVVGLSYGGFVGYSMAAQFREAVERLVLCAAPVCFEERDVKEGIFPSLDVEEAVSLLVPQTPEKVRELIKLLFYRKTWTMSSWLPADLIDIDNPHLNCFFQDYIDVMCSQHAEAKRELIRAVVRDRKHFNLPKITQCVIVTHLTEEVLVQILSQRGIDHINPTLLIWGDHDRLFPVKLARRMKRHIEGNSHLVIIKNAGHPVNLEKPELFYKHLKAFLTNSPPQVYEEQD